MIVSNLKIDGIDLYKLKSDIIKNKKLNEIIFIVPTKRKVRNLKKEIIQLSPNKTVSKLNIETLGTFTEKVYAEIENYIALTEATAIVLLKQASTNQKFKFFSTYEGEIPFGTLELLKNVISEYKRHGITPEKLKEESTKLSGSEKIKANDIADIYDDYNQKCYQIKAYEIGDVYNLILKKQKDFIQVFNKLYFEVKYVMLDGFDEFTELEVEILSLLKQITNLEIYFNFEYYDDNFQLFEHLYNSRKSLLRTGFTLINDLSVQNENEFNKIIKESLFKTDEYHLKSYESSIKSIACKNRKTEVQIIAKEIKDLLETNKILPNDIAVVFNSIENYTSNIREIFNYTGIPYNLTDRYSLDNSQPVILIINLLTIIDTDYYYKSIFKVISSGYLTDIIDNPETIIYSSTELRIIAGFENWIKTLNQNMYDEDEKEYSISPKVLKQAKIAFNQLSELLMPFRQEMTADEFFTKVKELILKIKLPEKVIKTINEYEEVNIKALTVFIETIKEVLELLEMEKGKSLKYDLSFFLTLIKTACSNVRFNIKEKPEYGVLVTSLNEIRGIKYKYLFIGGLCDGDFPTRYNPEIFISGSFRKGEMRHQADERFHFYQAISSWEEKLILTYPLNDAKKELEPSVFVKELKNLFSITELTADDFNNKIYSYDELLFTHTLSELKEQKDKFNNEFYSDICSEEIELKITNDKIRINSPTEIHEINGFICKDELNEQIPDIKYSATQLELYAQCPFKYFMRRILKIEGEKEPVEEIEALELGRILHDILFSFYTKLTEHNLSMSNCSEKVFEKAVNIMKEIASEYHNNEILNYSFSFHEKEKLFGINDDFTQSILYKFLTYERNESDEFKPELFELAFGYDEIYEINGVKIRGKIDRLEIDHKNIKINVVDYKLSGKKPTKEELLQGYSLQLPIYLIAAEDILNKIKSEKYSPNKMIIYSLKFNDDEFGKIAVNLSRKKDDNSIEELLDITRNKIKEIIENINSGKFNLADSEKIRSKICSYCEYGYICRVKEIYG